MSGFLSKLQVELVNPDMSGVWRLLAPLVYQSDAAGQTFTVPAGFETDFASVPRIPIIFELTGDTSQEAAALHDWLYSTCPVSRAMADTVLREASVSTNVPRWRAWLMWAGVRLGGASHYLDPQNNPKEPS